MATDCLEIVGADQYLDFRNHPLARALFNALGVCRLAECNRAVIYDHGVVRICSVRVSHVYARWCAARDKAELEEGVKELMR